MPTQKTPDALSPPALAQQVKAAARGVGFDLVGIAPAVPAPGHDRLERWLDAGYAGEMHYFERRRTAYAHPQHVLSVVRSVIVVALNYNTLPPRTDPPATVAGHGRIARYAWGAADYHDLIRERLRVVSDVLHQERPGCRTRVVVDTAPLLEREYGRLAGLGWFGKNTMLLNKQIGSWFFLAGLLTDVELPVDAVHDTAHCGSCTRCLEACPTRAFPEPGVLDATRCLSYLTIELRDSPVPEPLRTGLGDWVFGCDICQEVCPWNRKAPATTDAQLRPAGPCAATATHPPGQIELTELLSLSNEEFTDRLGQTPLARPGRVGMARNAALALGNTGGAAANASPSAGLCAALSDPSPLVRDAAGWAMQRLTDRTDAPPSVEVKRRD